LEFEQPRFDEAVDYCDDWRRASLSSVVLRVTSRPVQVTIFTRSNFLAMHRLYQRLTANVTGSLWLLKVDSLAIELVEVMALAAFIREVVVENAFAER